jgi:lipid-A-disaccharide synthase
MHVFFSVGEPSGDQHAAHLMAELSRRVPGIRCSGFGGPLMEMAGLDSLYRLTDLAIMGMGDVIPLYQKFRGLARQADEFFQRERPDLCVLVDFPGFNWHIAKAAKRAGVEVVYYCPPQLWAWASWRIRKLKRSVDRVLSVLPFEADWYRDRGVNVEYVGHPFFDEIAEKRLHEETLGRLRAASPRRVALLPGSRNQEVRRNFPTMVRVARRLAAKHPDLRFPVACYKESQRDFCQSVLDQQPDRLPIDLHLGATSEIIAAADCILMVSGSVSLEVLARDKPAVAMYRGSPVTWAIAWLLVHVWYMSLPNLMAGEELMPEFPFVKQPKKIARRMADLLDRWLSDDREMQTRIEAMRSLRLTAAKTGGIARAADALLSNRAATRRKHAA